MSRLGVAAAAVGFCVVGCGPIHQGAAATVGSSRISVSDLNTAVAHDLANSATPTDPSADRSSAVRSSLTTIVRNDLIADGAKSKGVTVSEADIQALLATQRQTNGTDENTAKANGIAFGDLHEAVYQALLLTKLEQKVYGSETDTTKQQQLFLAFLADVAKQRGVSINPRYGTWQADQFSVVAADAFSSQAPVASPAG